MNRTKTALLGTLFCAFLVAGLPRAGAAQTASADKGALPPSPAQLWRQIRSLQHSQSMMPMTHAFQPGSRTVDVYTTDLSNQAASAAITAAGSIPDVTRYPNGSLLVKENYNAKRQLTGVTAMLKLAFYDAANRNWVMAAYSPVGKEVAFGQVASCDACHTMVSKSDFVFAPPPVQLLPAAVWKAFFPKQAMSPAYLALLAKYPDAVVK